MRDLGHVWVTAFLHFLETIKFFLLVMGALVMFMQCGFAFLEAGAVRSKVNGINYFSSVFQNLRVVVSTKVHIVGLLTISFQAPPQPF